MESSYINENGAKVWKLPNGNLHREDGPAIEFLSGFKIWYINGVYYTEQERFV
jgi:hypothetical protein